MILLSTVWIVFKILKLTSEIFQIANCKCQGCRCFLFHVVDILFVQVVPEYNNESFKEKLTKLQTKPIFVQKINVF